MNTDPIDRARQALHAIDPGCDREAWVRAAMAAKAAGLDEADFLDWSEGAPNFDSARDCRSVWRSIKPEGGVGPGSLFKMAHEAGWREPLNGHHKPQDRPQAARKVNGHPASSFDADRVWGGSEPAAADHEYIARKLGLADGLRVYRGPLTVAGQALDGALLVPAFDADGKLMTWQAIPPGEGKKLNAPGRAVSGWFVVGPPLADGATAYVCEGIGAAWSAHQATRAAAVVAFGAGRVETVARSLRELRPGLRLVLVADVGKESQCERIARDLRCSWIASPGELGSNADINDLHQRDGLAAVAELLEQAKEPPAEDAEAWPGDGHIGEFLQTEAPPIAWFARERLLADRAHVLAGIGGSSKTRVLYHLGIGAVLGRVPWGWPIERTGSAALFLAEDTANGTHRTLAAMRHGMRLAPAEVEALSARMRVFPLAGKATRLLVAAHGGSLVESHLVAAMLETLRRLPPPLAFVGLDPALGLTEGDEMNATHQRRLGELADRIAIETGACVMLTTHAAKGLQMLDEIGSHTSRGSGAITDAVRGEFALRTMTALEARKFGITDMEERKSFVQLVGVKGNELPPAAFVPQWLRRTTGGVLEPAELSEREAVPVGKREMDALEVLRGLAATAAPQLKAWREACIAEGLVTGGNERAKEKAMERIRDALLDAGLIERGVSRGIFVPAGDESPDTHKTSPHPTPP